MLAALGLMLPCIVQAQIRTDGSLGPAAQTLAGPRYVIPETLGKLSGSNLFHSFQTFSIGSQESANFTTATTGIANVISRVTGGGLSQINGKLSMTAAAGAPNFYFINPSGVTFGAGAAIDVPGAFHVSTANYLKFPDGSFYADTKNASSFSSSAPEAFGFLGTSRASIVVKGNIDLATPAQHSVNLVAGDLEINNATIHASNGGNIRLAAVGAEAKDIPFTGSLPALSGTLNILEGGSVIAGAGVTREGGAITVGAGDITMTGMEQEGGQLMTGISSSAEMASSGNAGSIVVNASGNISIQNGAMINSGASSSGNGGTVAVTATGNLTLLNGGRIQAPTMSSGNAGSIKVVAGSLTIDGKGNVTGITAEAIRGSTGNAGSVEVAVTGNLTMRNGGVIASPTFARGDGGSVRVAAGQVTIDGESNGQAPTGLSSSAEATSSGKAGDVELAVQGNLTIRKGGTIGSPTFSIGDAGSVKVAAGNITIDGQVTGGLITGISSSAERGAKGNAGNVEVTALGNLSLLNRGTISSSARSSGNGGSVVVTALGNLSLENGGSIASPTYGDGNAGSVKVIAGNMSIDGRAISSEVIAAAMEGSTGQAGSVEVAIAQNLTITNGGTIDSSTAGSGNAGAVKVSAANITIDKQAGGQFPTGIASTAERSGTGNAGSVVVTAKGKLSVLNGAEISSTTYSSGNAGSVEVNALGNLSIGSGGRIESQTLSGGDAGFVTITADSLAIDGSGMPTGITGTAMRGSSGKAGSVNVAVAGNLLLVKGGNISSSTFSSGDAGAVRVTAGSITIDGQASGPSGGQAFTGISSSAESMSSGQAGKVDVTVAGDLSVFNSGSIASSAFSNGDAGSVRVSAGNITIDGQTNGRGFTGISSSAERGSSGNAGSVIVSALENLSILNGAKISSTAYSSGNAGSVAVTAGGNLSISSGSSIEAPALSSGNAGSLDVTASGNLSLSSGGLINSSTDSSGSAGSVKVNAGTVVVTGDFMGQRSGIIAVAGEKSSGQTGNVVVTATDSITLSDGGVIAIRNLATEVNNPASLTPTLLSLSAPNITVNGSQINAASSGKVAASNIEINFTGKLALASGSIITSANEGDGGSIRIQGGKVLSLNNSQITTSVMSTRNGNGGDINLGSDVLALQTGFIQANTAAANASGGNVAIDVKALVPSDNTLFLGGATVLGFRPGVPGFNVIQAAAPTGVSGNVSISSPALNISASLVELKYQILDTGGLGRNPCQINRGSALTPIGRGGFPSSAQNLLSLNAVPRDPDSNGARLSGLETFFLREEKQAKTSCIP